MKLSIALLALLGGGGASAQTTIPCPAPGSSSVLPGATTSSPLTVRIPIISAADGLCTIVHRNATDGSRRAPVARSYAGRQWEISAGKFTSRTPTGSTSSSTGLASVDCSAGSEHECDVTLPPLESAGQEYVLESFEHSLSPQAEAARFLEQVREITCAFIIWAGDLLFFHVMLDFYSSVHKKHYLISFRSLPPSLFVSTPTSTLLFFLHTALCYVFIIHYRLRSDPS